MQATPLLHANETNTPRLSRLVRMVQFAQEHPLTAAYAGITVSCVVVFGISILLDIGAAIPDNTELITIASQTALYSGLGSIASAIATVISHSQDQEDAGVDRELIALTTP